MSKRASKTKSEPLDSKKAQSHDLIDQIIEYHFGVGCTGHAFPIVYTFSRARIG